MSNDLKLTTFLFQSFKASYIKINKCAPFLFNVQITGPPTIIAMIIYITCTFIFIYFFIVWLLSISFIYFFLPQPSVLLYLGYSLQLLVRLRHVASNVDILISSKVRRKCSIWLNVLVSFRKSLIKYVFLRNFYKLSIYFIDIWIPHLP